LNNPDHTNPSLVYPDWQVPGHINAVCTTRTGGFSKPPFDGLNVGAHVQDDPESVLKNRLWLKNALHLPAEPCWLEQVHGVEVINADRHVQSEPPVADAAVSHKDNVVLGVMTADCLPVVLCEPEKRIIGIAHGGWRGLAGDILRHTVAAMNCEPVGITAWLGPAIGPQCFEVGDDVWDAFVARDWQMAQFFSATPDQKFLADIYAIARRQLQSLGVQTVTGGEFCTMTDRERFYSYRRDGNTGRMATLVWMTPDSTSR